MQLYVIRYGKSLLYLLLLPVFFVVVLTVLAFNLLTEQVFGSKRKAPPTYYQLTSWEQE